MINEKLVRATLWIAVPFNFTAAYALLLPGSMLGQLFGLPPEVPLVYPALLSFLVFGFGVVYMWLAVQRSIDRPLLAVLALGKAGVFIIVLALWLMGEGPGRGVLVATGDLVFAVIWGHWLLRTAARK
jgi:glucan phosphoethanolaminetransferase (alkaline phosphatase superfamily)